LLVLAFCHHGLGRQAGPWRRAHRLPGRHLRTSTPDNQWITFDTYAMWAGDRTTPACSERTSPLCGIPHPLHDGAPTWRAGRAQVAGPRLEGRDTAHMLLRRLRVESVKLLIRQRTDTRHLGGVDDREVLYPEEYPRGIVPDLLGNVAVKLFALLGIALFLG